MFYHFKIHKEGESFWAECVELDGCNTQGDTLEELRENMKEALNLYLSEPEDSKVVFNLPNEYQRKLKNIERVEVEPSVAFAMLLRRTRLIRKLTLQKMAALLKYKNINTYRKLEKAKTSNPELKTIANVTKHFHDFPIGLLFQR